MRRSTQANVNPLKVLMMYRSFNIWGPTVDKEEYIGQ